MYFLGSLGLNRLNCETEPPAAAAYSPIVYWETVQLRTGGRVRRCGALGSTQGTYWYNPISLYCYTATG